MGGRRVAEESQKGKGGRLYVGEARMGKRTTDEMRSKGLEVEVEAVPCVARRHDSFSRWRWRCGRGRQSLTNV